MDKNPINETRLIDDYKNALPNIKYINSVNLYLLNNTKLTFILIIFKGQS